jgi:hypothetical protein
MRRRIKIKDDCLMVEEILTLPKAIQKKMDLAVKLGSEEAVASLEQYLCWDDEVNDEAEHKYEAKEVPVAAAKGLTWQNNLVPRKERLT